MTVDLVHVPDDGLVGEVVDTLPRWVALLEPAAALATRIAGTAFVPRGLRNDPAAVAAAIMLGDELGIGPMQALAHVHVVEGRPAASAELMRALVLRAGHELWVEYADDHRAEVRGVRHGTERVLSATWTIDDARRAGLIRPRSGWQAYPRAMLTARATAELCRRAFPDAIAGLSYLAEELDDTQTSGGGADPAASPRRVTRRPRVTVESSTTGDQAAGPGGVDVAPAHSPLAVPASTPDLAAAASSEVPDVAESGAASGPGRPAPSPAAMTKLQAMLNAAGIKDRPRRLAIASTIAGRTVASSSELDAGEVSNLIDLLEHVTSGVVRIDWETNEDGEPVAFPVVVDDPPPPEEDPS